MQADPGTVGPTQVVHTILYNMTLQELYNTKFNLYPGAISFFQYPYNKLKSHTTVG